MGARRQIGDIHKKSTVHYFLWIQILILRDRYTFDAQILGLDLAMLSIQAPLFAIFLVSLVCADNTYYTIWPKDSSDSGTNKAINDELNLKVGTKNIYASESATIGFLFWYQQLSSDLVDHFSNWPGVSSSFVIRVRMPSCKASSRKAWLGFPIAIALCIRFT